jgi:hypothetical protein
MGCILYYHPSSVIVFINDNFQLFNEMIKKHSLLQGY